MSSKLSYSESCDEIALQPNFRIVVLSPWVGEGDDLVTISQTRTSERKTDYPSQFKYGFRVKSLKPWKVVRTVEGVKFIIPCSYPLLPFVTVELFHGTQVECQNFVK